MIRVSFKIVLAVTVLLNTCSDVAATGIRVRLFTAMKPQAAIFTARAGDYEIEIPGREPLLAVAGEPVLLFSAEGKVGVTTRHGRGLLADSLLLRVAGSSGVEGRFTLYIPAMAGSEREYSDGLFCRSDDGIFLILNETTVENYLAGVVRAEGGPGRPVEFYRVQSILARTFAWQNLGKHLSDGYNLCDDVHCQAYHGTSDDKTVAEAVRSTEEIVVAGRDSVIVLAAFHSNCGGQTASSEEAWVTALPHLKSVRDPHCTSSRNATWKASVPAKTWSDFLVSRGVSSQVASQGEMKFIQDTRKQYFVPEAGVSIPVALIRSEFGLRSAYFSLSASADSVRFEGRGYGHGVGLCQEGAMAMALEGYTCNEIIAFYFQDVILVKTEFVKFPPPVK
ncbi:MAG: SpoIID/LytB domain-containing protein [Bacteroidales bacterium]|jgi:stage II sporulation protein D|nr:SpoIID/LytB domain-containing protein [Bacteroidales bacterium]